ncbi:hypothetical protein QFC22_005532 [Naganishia vaughanmartiniae]|uniref:Uncharacterized protein n=1 Tax=Naganishia vaughanmartiniae TaxID=1424756 RepID=A0ACC2WV11_9TREE|nr:hypothetical protein QFC22_005532 [Naganishia vaughanmartiniae]
MSAAPSQSFRSQLSSFRWANSVQDDSAAAPAASSNPLSRAYSSITNSVSDYVPLRSSARSDEEEAYFALSVSRVPRLCSRRHRLLLRGIPYSPATSVTSNPINPKEVRDGVHARIVIVHGRVRRATRADEPDSDSGHCSSELAELLSDVDGAPDERA